MLLLVAGVGSAHEPFRTRRGGGVAAGGSSLGRRGHWTEGHSADRRRRQGRGACELGAALGPPKS